MEEESCKIERSGKIEGLLQLLLVGIVLTGAVIVLASLPSCKTPEETSGWDRRRMQMDGRKHGDPIIRDGIRKVPGGWVAVD